MDVNKIMEITHNYYQIKFDRLHEDNKHLRRANGKLKNEVRALKKVIYKLKQNKDKQFYKNGQRGTKLNATRPASTYKIMELIGYEMCGV